MVACVVAYCPNCRWRSSEISPIPVEAVAGTPCPTCGHAVNDIKFDPVFTGKDEKVSNRVTADAHLLSFGISAAIPVNVPLPTRKG